MIDTDIARLLERLNADPRPATPPPTVADHRAAMDRMPAALGPERRIELGSVVDSTIPGPAGDVPVRTYRATNEPTGTVVYFHGGGWMTGDLDSHDFLVRKLAHETGFGFVAVDYRLAPEQPFPAGLDDCTAAAMWVGDHSEDFGGIKGQLAVAGDGAGGTLAAVVARKFRDANRHLAAQLLLDPIIDPAGNYPSRDEYGEGYLVTAEVFAESAQVYLGNNPALITTEDVAPIRATDLSGLAPAVIGVAHADPVRDEGLAYADALVAAGVDVFVSDYRGMIHNFVSMFAISDGANRALTDVLDQFSKKMKFDPRQQPLAPRGG
jgi:acetyl esterase